MCVENRNFISLANENRENASDDRNSSDRSPSPHYRSPSPRSHSSEDDKPRRGSIYYMADDDDHRKEIEKDIVEADELFTRDGDHTRRHQSRNPEPHRFVSSDYETDGSDAEVADMRDRRSGD